MLLRKNHRHTGMDLRDELVRLARNNRAGAQPLPRFGILPVFPEPHKVNGLSCQTRSVDSDCSWCCFVKGSHRIVLGIHGSDFPGSEIGCFEPGNVFQDLRRSHNGLNVVLSICHRNISTEVSFNRHAGAVFKAKRALFSDIPSSGKISESIPLTEYFPFRAPTHFIMRRPEQCGR
jgi:hypothetical protein